MVPPNQAVKMFDSLKAKGIPTALVMFEVCLPGLKLCCGWKTSSCVSVYLLQVINTCVAQELPFPAV